MPAEKEPNFAIKGLKEFAKKTRWIGWGGLLVGILLPPVLLPAAELTFVNLAIDGTTQNYRMPRAAA